MRQSLSEACVGAELAEEPGARGLRHYAEQGDPTWWFEIDFDHASGSRAPGFTVRERRAQLGPSLEIDATFDASILHAGGLRKAVSRRSQDILSRVVRTCGDAATAFEPGKPCGRGESRTLCVSGESH